MANIKLRGVGRPLPLLQQNPLCTEFSERPCSSGGKERGAVASFSAEPAWRALTSQSRRGAGGDGECSQGRTAASQGPPGSGDRAHCSTAAASRNTFPKTRWEDGSRVTGNLGPRAAEVTPHAKQPGTGPGTCPLALPALHLAGLCVPLHPPPPPTPPSASPSCCLCLSLPLLDWIQILSESLLFGLQAPKG